MIPGTRTTKFKFLTTKMIRFFSWPRNFDVNINVIVVGTIEKLRIWIAETASMYDAKNIGIAIGATKTPINVNPIDAMMVNFFIFAVD